MKTSAEKSTTSTTTTPATAHRAGQQPFFQKSGLDERAAPRGGAMPAKVVQAKLSVNQPGDHFEREAERMADHVMSAPTIVKPEWATGRASDWASMAGDRLQKKEAERVQGKDAEAAPRKEAERGQRKDSGRVQRKEAEPAQRKEAERIQRKDGERVQRKESGAAPQVDSATQSALMNQMSGGEALSAETRGFMEPRFGADFSGVRVHRDRESAGLSNRLGARAFTLRNHVFFSDNQFQPGTRDGKHLLAHELTHTIQQGQSVRRSAQPAVERGAQPAVQRSPQVSTNSATPAIQRLGVQDALDYFADKAYYIPGYRLLTIVLGFNPINQRSADRSAANILRALVELIPGGALIAQALDNHGVFTRAGAWVEQQLATLGDIGGAIVAGLARFIDSLSWRDIFDLGGVWDRAKAIFTNPIGRLISFGAGVVTGLMAIVREVVLRPLAALAEGTAGYDLLKAVLGQDPVTGEAVPRSPALLIGGFMKLIGQEEVWQNIQKGNAIGRAWDWFQGALEGLMGFVRAIPGQIVDTLRSITWQDVLTITGLFSKVGRAFLNVAGQFLSWAGAQVITLLEIIFSVVAPRAVPYIKKAQGAFRSIIQNPIGFVGNLVRAGKLGFQNFAANIGAHLKTALIKWITGPLGEAGVYIPKEFSLIEIVKLVLSVLGLTWTNIRSKLVKIIPDPVLTVLEKTAGVLVTLVRDGPAAAWQEIKNELNELKDSMIAKVTEMVTTEIVKAAVTKLVTMLNPAGAVIQAIIAIYNTISFFIQKINQIAAVVASFIDSIAAIAAGQLGPAAKRVEQTLANTLLIVIGFLAKFAGLGGIPDKLVGVVKKIRAPIDKAPRQDRRLARRPAQEDRRGGQGGPAQAAQLVAQEGAGQGRRRKPHLDLRRRGQGGQAGAALRPGAALGVPDRHGDHAPPGEGEERQADQHGGDPRGGDRADPKGAARAGRRRPRLHHRRHRLRQGRHQGRQAVQTARRQAGHAGGPRRRNAGGLAGERSGGDEGRHRHHPRQLQLPAEGARRRAARRQERAGLRQQEQGLEQAGHARRRPAGAAPRHLGARHVDPLQHRAGRQEGLRGQGAAGAARFGGRRADAGARPEAGQPAGLRQDALQQVLWLRPQPVHRRPAGEQHAAGEHRPLPSRDGRQ
ncbi:DUF4157 domain-containing protein [Rugamonas sp. DEMB1]|uniref:eCIS core domain-containing protein n=1 Tax=Rugamonas sp. DEMB1 TaxID=3039386 RepID=UPI002446AECF|nr:DUF4157 domain-containing protein [Rugamonas sp. DEMB1]WGG48135.1 DUF4157 domain-containing protein [Rugamonas sp. DEMB1]